MPYRNEDYNSRYYPGHENRGYHSSDYNRHSDRDWWERAGDEVQSWFGSEAAERRRRLDERRDRYYDRASHYGRFQRSAYGRGLYSVPGLEPGDPNFGKAEYEWSANSPIRHQGRYGGQPNPRQHTRNLAARAGDKVRSWFGDEEAERRRRIDDHRSRRGNTGHSTYNRGHDMSWTHNYESDLNRDWVNRHNQFINRGRTHFGDYDRW